jgi:CRP-like cAMP-binding protein
MKDLETERLLSAMPLFRGLSRNDSARLAKLVRERHYPAGSILFLEGDPGDFAHIVLSGRVHISVTSLDGEELLLHEAGQGDYFGELALLDGQPRSAAATAVDETTTLCIAREDLLEHLRTHPEAALLMLRFTSERLRRADEKIKMLGFLDVAGRLARSLVDLDQPAGKRASIRVNHGQLAAMIGSRRPTVTLLLGSWRSAGYVVTGRGRITVVDRGALEDLASM